MRGDSQPDWEGDVDIPPAIACAHCGEPGCDGCARRNTSSVNCQAEQGVNRFPIPWEDQKLSRRARLIDTARLVTFKPEFAFGTLGAGPIGPALRFSLWAEFWAVGSYSLLWTAFVFAAFPFLSAHFFSTRLVLLLALSIFVSLVLFVVLTHAAWGLVLEWAIKRDNKPPLYSLGLRFGLYACGWDLITSPAGFFLLLENGIRPALRNVVQGARVPRSAVDSYLTKRRGLSDKEKKRAVLTSLIVLGVGALTFGVLLLLLLLGIWLPMLFS